MAKGPHPDAICPFAQITWTDYTIVFVLSVVGVILSSTMFTAQMQFYCRNSDPVLGGTYM